MIRLTRSPGATPLDDFLAGASSSTARGELLQRAGLIDSLTGITLAVGLLVFLAVVHRGPPSEVTLLTRVVNVVGAVVLAGAAIEIAGAASIEGIGWSAAFGDSTNAAAMMRLLAGLLLMLGIVDHHARCDDAMHDPPQDARRLATGGADAMPTATTTDLRATSPTTTTLGHDDPLQDDPLHDDPLHDDPHHDDPHHDASDVSWVPSSASAFGLGGAIVGVLSFVFDGHTVTEGPRVLHALVDLVHVSAAGVWFGGIVGLAIVSWVRRRGVSTALLAVRFSAVATYALITVALAGSLMSLMITDGWGDFTGTPWGRRLLVKLGAVAVAVALGAYNHYVVTPALERDAHDVAMLRRARTTVTVEAVVLLFVAIATVFLTFASPN